MRDPSEAACPTCPPAGAWPDAPAPWRASAGPVAHRGLLLDADPSAPGVARRFMTPLATHLGDDAMQDLFLLVSELVTNAVIHTPAPTGPGAIGVDVHALPGSVVVTVTDPGPGFDPARLRRSRPGLPGGRGLELVTLLTPRRGIEGRSPFAVWFEVTG